MRNLTLYLHAKVIFKKLPIKEEFLRQSFLCSLGHNNHNIVMYFDKRGGVVGIASLDEVELKTENLGKLLCEPCVTYSGMGRM